ncbi:MAG: BamA/TamA family outer membrane protein [Armatimonadota bacterium]|nr:BamA/TamA family outer membrane protein [Armatimonadota bacterium]
MPFFVHVRLPLIACGLATVVLLAPQVPSALAQPTPTPRPSPAATPALSPAPAPTPAVQPSPSPVPAPGPSPSPGPAQSPAPSPAPSPTPGPPPKIVEIAVRGLERVPESVVLDSIGVRVGELLSEERLRADVAAVVGTGWFADANVRVEPLRDGVRVTFLVVENPMITEIVVEGNTKIPTPEILQVLNLPTGQVLNIVRLRDGARAVEKLYEDRGYVLARVADIGVVSNGATRLRLRIAEGQIEAIEYKGLQKTRPYVLARGRKTQVGGVFNINDVNQDLQALVKLDLFENVQARPRPGSTPETVVLEIEVKEQRTQTARFGLGYGDRTGLVGLIEYTEKNWKGRNQTVNIRLERGLLSQQGQGGVTSARDPVVTNYVFSFREPYLDARQTAMEISLYQSVTREAEYLSGAISSRFALDRLGASLSFSRPVDATTTLTLRLRSERTEITPLPRDPLTPPCDTNPDDPLCPKPPPSFLSSGRVIVLSLSGVRDRRDSPVQPTKGDRWSLSNEFGLPVLGGDFGYGRHAVEYSRYFPAGSGVIVGRALLGFSYGTLPLQEQFVLGGPSSLRAYPAARLRGTSAGLFNAEYRVPLGFVARQLRDFTGIIYVDVGASPLFNNALIGYGLGVSVNTAVGAIRIDYSIGSEGSQTWVTIGQPF